MEPELQRTGFELAPGSRVGKYEVLRKLATGGMAEIYLVRFGGTGGFEKVLVLKRLLPSVVDDAQFVRMFLDEARLAATLRHPNIADVLDVGESGGGYFFTMEYIHGQDVRSIRHASRERNEIVPLPIALAIVHGVATALHHAHEKLGADGTPLGLVHRDVSSTNVMVSYDGAVKLLDFGVARVATSTHATQIGTFKGKVPYMSPEQCRCLPLDRRSDLFSLGVIMFELTVGRRPFRGETQFEIMEQIVHHPPPRPKDIVQGYPVELDAIVSRLFQHVPANRYPTADELLHDLDGYIAKHGQWLSSRAIGKYMRTLFSNKIEAWQRAQDEGVPFAEHIASTITSESLRSASVTPRPETELPTKLEIPRLVAPDDAAEPSARNEVVAPAAPDDVVAPAAPELAIAPDDSPSVLWGPDVAPIAPVVEQRRLPTDPPRRISEPVPAQPSERVSEQHIAPRDDYASVEYADVEPDVMRSRRGSLLGVFLLLLLAGGGVLAFFLLQADVEKQRLGPRTGGGPIEMMGSTDAAPND